MKCFFFALVSSIVCNGIELPNAPDKNTRLVRVNFLLVFFCCWWGSLLVQPLGRRRSNHSSLQEADISADTLFVVSLLFDVCSSV